LGATEVDGEVLASYRDQGGYRETVEDALLKAVID
jgi:hypothetical protein